MRNLLKKYRESSGQIKIFIWVNVIFWAAIAITTIYCYARLDYVRSYAKKDHYEQKT